MSVTHIPWHATEDVIDIWNRDFPICARQLPRTCHSTIRLHQPWRLCPRHDTPAADLVVGVTSEQGLAVGAPGQGHALRLPALLADLHVLRLQLVNLGLLLEVEDDDAGGGGSAQPVAVGREDEGVDLVTGGERVQVLGLVQVPEHGCSVLATGGAERAIGGDGDGVDVAGVTDVVGLNAARSELPNLWYCQRLLAANVESERIASCKISTKVSVVLIALDGGSEVANTFLTKSS